MNLVLHPRTKQNIDNFINKPSHGLLLVGPAGSGKGSLAKDIASKLLNIETSKIDSYQYFKIIADKKSISIDDIRDINSFLKLKTAGQAIYRRAIIIEQIENLSQEAQNAFLKNLEEPPQDTFIILTSSIPNSILSTITSRVQQIKVISPLKEDLTEFFSKNFSAVKINKAFLLSDGCAGLMSALLTQDNEHALVQQIETAKEIYRKSVFERLNLIDSIIKKSNLPDFFTAMDRVCHVALINAVDKNDPSIPAWLNRTSVINDTLGFMQNNPNQKLLLTNLFINI